MSRCATVAAMTVVPLSVSTAWPQAIAAADSCSDATLDRPLDSGLGPCADVLAQERRWLTAITEGDRATVESILAPDFKHVDSDGRLFDRAQEIASVEKAPFTMNPSEQLVDIADDTAVIHGINTLIGGDEVLARERFTDVFVLQNGTWTALSAQETTLG